MKKSLNKGSYPFSKFEGKYTSFSLNMSHANLLIFHTMLSYKVVEPFNVRFTNKTKT